MIHTFLRLATVKRKDVEQFQLEVICTNCKRRGILWLFKDYKISAHACPNCYKKKLQTPAWLNHHKQTTIFLNKEFK